MKGNSHVLVGEFANARVCVRRGTCVVEEGDGESGIPVLEQGSTIAIKDSRLAPEHAELIREEGDGVLPLTEFKQQRSRIPSSIVVQRIVIQNREEVRQCPIGEAGGA